MRPSLALAAGALCAALAVAVVAADLAWNVEATLERWEGDAWSTVAQSPDPRLERHVSVPGCEGNRFRLTLHNGLPWATEVEVAAQVDGSPVGELPPARVRLAAGETWVREFTVPAADLAGEGPDSKPMGYVLVQVDRQHLSACAGAGGA